MSRPEQDRMDMLVRTLVVASSTAPAVSEIAEALGIGPAALDRLILAAEADDRIEAWPGRGCPPWVDPEADDAGDDRIVLTPAVVEELDLIVYETGNRQTPRWATRAAERAWLNRKKKAGRFSERAEVDNPLDLLEDPNTPMSALIAREADAARASRIERLRAQLDRAKRDGLTPVEAAALAVARDDEEGKLGWCRLVGVGTIWPTRPGPDGECGSCLGLRLDHRTVCLECCSSRTHTPPGPPPRDEAAARRSQLAVFSGRRKAVTPPR